MVLTRMYIQYFNILSYEVIRNSFESRMSLLRRTINGSRLKILWNISSQFSENKNKRLESVTIFDLIREEKLGKS